MIVLHQFDSDTFDKHLKSCVLKMYIVVDVMLMLTNIDDKH